MAVSKSPAHVLVVDDDEGMLVLMAETLRGEGYGVSTARSAKTARAALERRPPDLLVLDLKLPDGSGPALVAEVRRDKAQVPFIVVTGQGDEKVAVEVMKQGALDYVMKDTALLDVLPTIVQRALTAAGQEKALAAAREEHKRLEREILAVSERERHTIGADLHDGLGQQLTALELMCTALKEDSTQNPELFRQLDQMSKMLREAIAQTRFLARGLVPVGSDPDALAIGLSELAGRTNALKRIHCEFHQHGHVTLSDPFAASHLYRIAQEAVNNAVKHAHATHITVSLAEEQGVVTLQISDDGVGLPKDVHPGLGLGVIQHRASVVGADLDISSERGKGVTITCRLSLAAVLDRAPEKPAAAPAEG